MSSDRSWSHNCPLCSNVPQRPMVLPCHHICCIKCLESYVSQQTGDSSTRRLVCPAAACGRPFSSLPKPERGCEPVGSVHQKFTADNFLSSPEFLGIVGDVKHKVMGLAILFNRLYVVYHKQSTIYTYSTSPPYGRLSAPDTNELKWPRGMAASRRHRCLYVTDWNKMFAGRLCFVAENVTQFRVVAELDIQPFGVSYCEKSDRVLVVCSTPLKQAVPFISKSSRIIIYLAATNKLERVIHLDDAYEIPRYALTVEDNFMVCYGWLQSGKVVLIGHGEHQIPGCYGSDVRSGEQSLSRPLSMHDAGENHILVVDYMQHRIHLVTHQLQFVKHLVSKGQSSRGSDADRGVTYPRNVCMDGPVLYVGTESGAIGVYRVMSCAVGGGGTS